VKKGENSDMIEKYSLNSVKAEKTPQTQVLIISQCVENIAEDHLWCKKVVNGDKKVVTSKIITNLSENLLKQRLDGKCKAIVIWEI